MGLWGYGVFGFMDLWVSGFVGLWGLGLRFRASWFLGMLGPPGLQPFWA